MSWKCHFKSPSWSAMMRCAKLHSDMEVLTLASSQISTHPCICKCICFCLWNTCTSNDEIYCIYTKDVNDTSSLVSYSSFPPYCSLSLDLGLTFFAQWHYPFSNVKIDLCICMLIMFKYTTIKQCHIREPFTVPLLYPFIVLHVSASSPKIFIWALCQFTNAVLAQTSF